MERSVGRRLQISDTLDFIGASLSAGCGEDLATASMTVLKKDLGTGLELLAEVLTQSNFPQEEIDRQKQSIIASIKAREESPGDIAREKICRGALSTEPLRAAGGRKRSLGQGTGTTKPERILRSLLPTQSNDFSVVGDISHQEIARALNEAFRSWHKGEPVTAAVAPSKIGSAETIRVNKDLTQANIVLGHEGVGRENPDYYAIQVMNYILGGGGFCLAYSERHPKRTGVGVLGLQLLQCRQRPWHFRAGHADKE